MAPSKASKPARRPSGTGGLKWSESRRRWRVRLDRPHKPDGTRDTVDRYFVSYEEAKRELRRLQAELTTTGTIASSITVNKFLDGWLQVKKNELRPRGYKSYESPIRNHIKPAIGKVKLDKLSVEHVRTMMTALAPATARDVRRVLRNALNDALREGLVVRNVAALAKPPKGVKVKTRTAFTEEEIGKFIDADADGFWTFMLTGGPRRGEALGLEYDRITTLTDADGIETHTAEVDWQLQRQPFRHGCLNAKGVRTCKFKTPGRCPQRELDVPDWFEVRQLDGGLCLVKPKTAAGIRRAPIVRAVMAKIKANQKKHGRIGGLVWTRPDGRPHDPELITNEFKAFCVRAGIRPLTQHEARHTFVTWQKANGAKAKALGLVVGHTDESTTDAYDHPDIEQIRENAEKMTG